MLLGIKLFFKFDDAVCKTVLVFFNLFDSVFAFWAVNSWFFGFSLKNFNKITYCNLFFKFFVSTRIYVVKELSLFESRDRNLEFVKQFWNFFKFDKTRLISIKGLQPFTNLNLIVINVCLNSCDNFLTVVNHQFLLYFLF